MSAATLPADATWLVTTFLLGRTEGARRGRLRLTTTRAGDQSHARLLDLVRFASSCRALRACVYGDARVKAMALCLAPGEEARGGIFAVMDEYLSQARVKAPDAWRRARDVVLAAVKVDTNVLSTVDARFLDDKDVAIAAISNEKVSLLFGDQEKTYKKVSARLQNDHDVARAALEQLCFLDAGSDSLADMLPAALRDSKALMLEAMRGECPLSVASERLRGDRDVVLLAVAQRAAALTMNLAFASDALKDDRGVIEAAVRASGGGFLALQHASARLRDDRELALEAIRLHRHKDSAHLLHEGYGALSPRLLADRPLFLAALAKNDEASSQDRHSVDIHGVEELLEAAPALGGDKVAVLAAVSRAASAIQCAHPSLCADRDVVLTAIAQDGHAISCATGGLDADRACVLAAVRRTGSALMHVPEFCDDYEIALAACTNEGAALEYVSRRLRDDRTIRAAARAERAALIERAGGDLSRWDRSMSREQAQREARAQEFNLRPEHRWDD